MIIIRFKVRDKEIKIKTHSSFSFSFVNSEGQFSEVQGLGRYTLVDAQRKRTGRIPITHQVYILLKEQVKTLRECSLVKAWT